LEYFFLVGVVIVGLVWFGKFDILPLWIDLVNFIHSFFYSLFSLLVGVFIDRIFREFVCPSSVVVIG